MRNQYQSGSQNTIPYVLKIEDVLRCEGYEDLSNDQAQLVVESLRLFCEILADAYFIAGKIH